MNRNMINRLTVAALSVALPLACLSSAHAQSLNFELPSLPSGGGNGYEQILNYYNGGADQYGDVGPNYGIVFGSDALALGQYPAAPNSNVGNEPGGGNALFFLSGSGDIMNVAAGFNTGFSFYYSAADSGSITVWSGQNGTGTELASLALPAYGNQYPTEPYYDGWAPIGVTFSGTAESVVFSGTANYIDFTDVTLNSGTPAGVPETTGMNICMLTALALAGAGWAFRKQGIATL
jgi:hypothetical protein